MAKALSFILLFAFVFMGCESTFEPAIPASPQKLVINSQFTPGSPWIVHLSHSRDLLSADEFDVVSNASVEVFDGNNLVQKLSFVPPTSINPGYYRGAASLPEVGVDYTLRVSSPDYPSATATDRVPETGIEIGLFEFLHKSEEGDEIFTLNMQDLNPGNDDYYHVIVMLQTYQFANPDVDSSLVLVDQRAAKVDLREEPEFHETDHANIFSIRDSEGLLLSDLEFNQGSRNVELKVLSQSYNGTVGNSDEVFAFVVELRSVSKAYFEFERTKAEQLNQQNAGAFFPVDVESNVEGGLGIFSGYDVINSAIIWQE